MSAAYAPRRTVTCSICNKTGHNKRTCSDKSEHTRACSDKPEHTRTCSSEYVARHIKCSICKQPGHNKRTCQMVNPEMSKSKKTEKKFKNDIKIFVISVDNEKGRERRKLLNYKYKWIKAIYMDDSNNSILKKVRSKATIRYNMSKDSKKYKAATANISSHIKILKMIVKQNLKNVIILEDDSIQNTDLPKISELPTDAPTLFSGQLAHPHSWNEDKEWKKKKAKKVINSFQKGVNKIDYDKYRWTQSNALFIPNKHVAEHILKVLDEIKSFKLYYDMLLSHNKLVPYLYYPAPFRHDDTMVPSQITGHTIGNIENYILKSK